MNRLIPALAVVLLGLMVLSMSVFTVDQRQAAMVFQLGEVVRVVKEPGIRFKVPLLQSVRYFDRRILTMDAESPERFNTIEKKNVLVDSYVKWQVIDVEQYYKSVGGSERIAAARLRKTVNDVLRAEFGKQTVQDVISGKRDEVMEVVGQVADADARKIGVRIVDVRLKRVDFPNDISNAVFDRMISERKTVANQLRSEGSAEAEKIRADADRQREVILAEAYNKAQQLKGEGDGRAASIYGAAYGQNPEFYAFYRSLDAYKQTFKSKSDVMVVDPSSAFFKYMKDPRAK
ncbi:protease modulator HflC [Chitinimonas taiwanensis]|jgi:modulator of FtsH protease HflC|uniref:Protein HflC n=1 Tax=Chitinimonas taiwanensis DSM 18899 TaxID=1121279 RepID=A0A1K2H8Z4_9NEIS|nr:protease modulator HflC [Chitinimonas taiwanensis]SFZ72582.1 protease FtsH subunit HflC [Chitinimonas taiwanensis DSM 18899]